MNYSVVCKYRPRSETDITQRFERCIPGSSPGEGTTKYKGLVYGKGATKKISIKFYGIKQRDQKYNKKQYFSDY